jgi:transcriptional/translational regulatory protein YebC/TACO1
MEPSNLVEIDESSAASLLRLLDALEEHDDVNEVHANFDISQELLEKVA